MIFLKIGFYTYFKLLGRPLSILHFLAVKIGFRFGYSNKSKKKNGLLKKNFPRVSNSWKVVRPYKNKNQRKSVTSVASVVYQTATSETPKSSSDNAFKSKPTNVPELINSTF